MTHGARYERRNARYCRDGKPFTLFNIVVGDGEARQYVSVIVFGDAASKVATLEKGRRVYVEGKIEINEWTDRDGNKKRGLKVVSFNAMEVSKIGRRRERKSGDAEKETSAGAAPAHDGFNSDEIPF